MKIFFRNLLGFAVLLTGQNAQALSSGDVSVRLISGYFWVDNSCTVGGPLGKVVSFRIKNTKGSLLQGVSIDLGTLSFTAAGGVTYTSGTPSFTCRTSKTVYIGNIAAGDSATAFFFVGYNCLMYPNNTNITTDYVTLPVTLRDANAGTVSTSFTKVMYVLRNANNNTITVLATSTNLVGTLMTISVAYNISNVKPGNIIDMELSTTSTFPAGYDIMSCKITATTIPTDFPVGQKNTHYSNSILSNLPSGGTVTIEWTLKITGTLTGITSSNIVPYIVSDAGSAQRWQANTTTFVSTLTPTSSLSMTKRVNVNLVLPSDTVFYTIVIKNSSPTTDVTIDKLVDDLPRDYQFRYMETNTGIFPRLVTYSNCTTNPPFLDTNYLYFCGVKEISPGIFSWVIPKHDSIKLIYSVKVSSTVGTKDTNKIQAYVGSTSVASAFAVVNVVSSLPVKVANYRVEHDAKGLALSWWAYDADRGAHFNVSRQIDGGDFVKIAEIQSDLGNVTSYSYLDNLPLMSGKIVSYKLEYQDANGVQYSAVVTTELAGNHDFTVLKPGNNQLAIGNLKEGISSARVIVSDVSGRLLFDDMINRNGMILEVPIDIALLSGSCIFITLETASAIQTKKIILQ